MELGAVVQDEEPSVLFSNLPETKAGFDIQFSRILHGLNWESLLADAKKWVCEIGKDYLSTHTSIIKIADSHQEEILNRFNVDIFHILHNEVKSLAPPKYYIIETMVWLAAALIGDIFGCNLKPDNQPTEPLDDWNDLIVEGELDTRQDIRQEASKLALVRGESDTLMAQAREEAEARDQFNKRKDKKATSRMRLKSKIQSALTSLHGAKKQRQKSD